MAPQQARIANIPLMFQLIVTQFYSPLTFFSHTQQALAIAHHRFDDAEHRFRGLLAHPVEFITAWRAQSIRHLLQRSGRVGRGFGRCKNALLPCHVMVAAPHGDQRLDLRCFALFDVALAQIPVIQSTYSSTHRTNAIQANFNDPERVAHYTQQGPPAFAPGHAGMLQMVGVLLAERTPETGHQRTVR
jgi:hypothetical protein